jgi:ATP-dependent RNA helicase HelY
MPRKPKEAPPASNSTPASDLIAEFRARYVFPLDAFQEEAIAHLANDENIMVAAPTGTGKTVVAEFGVFRMAQKGLRVMYTTPIKALSNQKFRDLRDQYGADRVGLLTGDIIENRKGQIMVMTTEVLRNMLLQTPSELWDVGCIIFDEIHYLADPERGTTWEESIIMCPQYIQLVCLSATVSNAPEVAEWIGRTHRPIHLVTHLKRAVPLSLYYFLDGNLNLVINAKGQQVVDFNVGGEIRKKQMRGSRHAPVLEEERVSRERTEPTPREIVEALEKADLLPAIFFQFSRRDCEAAAEVCAMMRLQAVRDPGTLARINAVLDSYLERLSPEDRRLEQVQLLVYLAQRGFGFHHAGLLPVLKQLVEELFGAALMRVVFATDTLALGVNMPARTVVIGRMSKWDGVSKRPLLPNEFQQMAGRAGRRGIDEQGHVVIPYSPFVTFHEALNIATGPLRPVESAFTIRYNSVLNLWETPRAGDEGRKTNDGGRWTVDGGQQASGSGDVRQATGDSRIPASEGRPPSFVLRPSSSPEERILGVMRASLLQFQQSRRLRDLEEGLEEEDERLASVPVGCLIGYENGEELLDEYERLGRVVEEARRREKKAEQNVLYLQSQKEGIPWRRPERDQVRRAFKTLPLGALVHLDGRGWAVYLGRGLGAVIGLFLGIGERGSGISNNPKSKIQNPKLTESSVLAMNEYRQIDYLPEPPVALQLPYPLTTLAVPPTVPLDALLSGEEMAALEVELGEALEQVPDLEAWIAEYRAGLSSQVAEAADKAQAGLDEMRREVRQAAEAERKHVCHQCSVRKEHRTYRRQRARLMLDRDAAERRLQERTRYEETRLQNTLKGLVNVLVQFSYIRKGELTYKAKKLADVFDSNALMITEMIEGNYLEGLQPEDLAEVFSWFAYDRDIDFLNRLLLPRYLVNLRRELDDLQNAIFQAERRQDLRLTPGYNPFFYGAARSWCKGTSLADILDSLDLSEGDLVMTFNKTLDIMRQARDMFVHHDPEHPIRAGLEEADRMMRRGVVEMAYTLGFAPVGEQPGNSAEAEV